MAIRLFIDGAAGTTGLEIRERLQGRGEFELMVLDEAQRKDERARPRRAPRCRYRDPFACRTMPQKRL